MNARPAPLEWRSGSHRLPAAIAEPLIVEPFLDLCRKHGVDPCFCACHLIETR